MTQEDKKLLLQDLCARLPYGVVLDVDTTDWKAPQGHLKVKVEGFGVLFKDMSLIVNGSYYGDKYKPYLRPISSMTEEEKNTYDRMIMCNAPWMVCDWLSSHHFDYRDLIGKGLALEATEGMYIIKQD